MEGNTNELQSRKDEWRKGNFRGIADLWKYNNENATSTLGKCNGFGQDFIVNRN